jgi:hypothetical protein
LIRSNKGRLAKCQPVFYSSIKHDKYAKGIKAGILIVALAVPALIFLFLRGFGENHYKLPKLIPVIDSTTGYIKMKKTRIRNGMNPKWIPFFILFLIGH